MEQLLSFVKFEHHIIIIMIGLLPRIILSPGHSISRGTCNKKTTGTSHPFHVLGECTAFIII